MNNDRLVVRAESALTYELMNALVDAEEGSCLELNKIMSRERSAVKCIDKFGYSSFYISKLAGGVDPHEILDEIYWSVR